MRLQKALLLLALAAALFAALGGAPLARAVAPPRSLATLLQTSSALRTKETPGHVYAVGDLHGDLELAQKLFNDKLWTEGCTMDNYATPECKWVAKNTIVVLLGDYVDRGAWSKKMYLWLKNLHLQSQQDGEGEQKKNSRLIPLKGNHEYMMLFGSWTYVSLQDDVPVEPTDWDFDGSRSKFFDAEAEDSDHQVGKWVRSLPFWVRIGKTVFTHGGIQSEKKLVKQNEQEEILKPSSIYKTVKSLAELENTEQGMIDSLCFDWSNSPSWSRLFAKDQNCPKLIKALGELSKTNPVHRMVVGHSRVCGKPHHFRCGEERNQVELYGMDVCFSRYFTYFGVAYAKRGSVVAGPRDIDAGGFVMPLRIKCKHLDASASLCEEDGHEANPLLSAEVETGDYLDQATRVIAACSLTPPTHLLPEYGLIPEAIRDACLAKTQALLTQDKGPFKTKFGVKNTKVVTDHCIGQQTADFAKAAESVIPNQTGISQEKADTFFTCIKSQLG